MSIQTSRINPRLAVLAVCFSLGLGGAAGADDLELSLPEAQAMAEAALAQGRPKLAYALSDGLLQADPGNGQAHYLQAAALASLRDFRGGNSAAARAYRSADTDLQRYQAAQLAAQMTYLDERYTLSQLWLRRAVHYAPNEEVRETSVRAFQTVRRRNPVHADLRFSISPSDNVNNGANSPYNLIEGSPLVGTLSPSAQAIDGFVATIDLQGMYRLRDSEVSETRLTGRVYSRQVEFDDPVPGISADDLASTRAEAGVSHLYSGANDDGFWQLDLTGGRTWYGGDLLYDFAGVGAQRVHRLTDTIKLGFGASVEEQFDQTVFNADATVYGAFAGLSYMFEGGGVLGAQVRYRETVSNGQNRAAQQWTGLLSYAMGQPVGPARMTFAVGHSTLDYDRYAVIFPVPGGRLDESWFGGVTAAFEDWSYMGLIPTVSLRGEKSRSNITRFNVDQTSLSIGIRSEF